MRARERRNGPRHEPSRLRVKQFSTKPKQTRTERIRMRSERKQMKAEPNRSRAGPDRMKARLKEKGPERDSRLFECPDPVLDRDDSGLIRNGLVHTCF